MAEHLYTGLVSKQLRGNREDARTLEREARIKVGYLFDRMLPGQTFTSGSWSLGDGRGITAFVWNDVLGRRATVRMTGIGGEIGKVESVFTFESGLMTHGDTLPWDFEIELGNPILYLSSGAVTYFQGNGTYFMPDKYIYLNGALTFPKLPPYDFLMLNSIKNKPVNGSQYLSVGHTETLEMADMDPLAWLAIGRYVEYGTFNISSMYTGLMRLAVQSKLALGTSAIKQLRLHELFPWGIGPPFGGSVNAYEHDGLLRTTDYTYFVVRTTATECKACRMTTDTALTDLKQRLIAGEWDGDEKNRSRVEAMLLSSLVPATLENGDLDEVVLLGENSLTPSYDPAIGSALAYGWHYSYPATGNTYECSIIRHGSAFDEVKGCITRVSYLTTIIFTLEKSDESWSVSAIADTSLQGNWALNNFITTIWAPRILHRFQLQVLVDDFCGLDVVTDPIDVPVYCFYDKSAGLQLVNFEHSYTTTTEMHEPSLASRIAMCYATSTFSALNLSGVRRLGFSVGQSTITSTVEAASSWTEYTGQTSISEGTPSRFTVNGVCNTINPLHYDIAQCTSSPKVPYCPVTPAPYIKEYIDSIDPNNGDLYTVKQYSLPIELESYIPITAASLIIPRLNAEAVVCLQRIAKTRDKISTSTWRTDVKYYTVSQHDFFSNISRTPEVFVDSWNYRCGFAVEGGSYLSCGNWLKEGVILGDDFITTNRRSLNTPVLTSSVEQERQYTQKLYTSSTQPIDLEEGKYNYYFNFYRFLDFVSFSAQQSAEGKMRYPGDSFASGLNGDAPGALILTNDYINEADIKDKRVVRWIGWE